jgi:hypothetical protein
MNPEDTYVSKVKGIPGGQIKIVWSVIWNMVPIIAAAPAIRDALHGKKQIKRSRVLEVKCKPLSTLSLS